MGSNLQPIIFDPAKFEKEIAAFDKLLKKPNLSEKRDIQPFFKKNLHLTAYIACYAAQPGPATEYAFEFDLFGDYKPDLVLGNKKARHFWVVEFENGRADSIFKSQTNRANPEWSYRFEHGFSQIVDWFYKLDDYKKTDGFSRIFGYGYAGFTALLVIGRDRGLDEAKRNRLKWRADKVVVDSKSVSCVTFDELHRELRDKYIMYKEASKVEPKPKKK